MLEEGGGTGCLGLSEETLTREQCCGPAGPGNGERAVTSAGSDKPHRAASVTLAPSPGPGAASCRHSCCPSQGPFPAPSALPPAPRAPACFSPQDYAGCQPGPRARAPLPLACWQWSVGLSQPLLTHAPGSCPFPTGNCTDIRVRWLLSRPGAAACLPGTGLAQLSARPRGSRHFNAIPEEAVAQPSPGAGGNADAGGAVRAVGEAALLASVHRAPANAQDGRSVQQAPAAGMGPGDPVQGGA